MFFKVHNTCIVGGGASNKLLSALLVLISAFLIFSCKNFLDGNQELQELQKAVDYANAPYVKIKFDCNPESLQLMVPSAGEVNDKYKAGDIISLTFEANDRYQFIKWTATPSSSVSFADPTKNATTATILDSSSPITISQVCAARPNIIGMSPGIGAENVNPFKIIKITFDQPMDESSIYWTYDELVEEITSQGKNVDDYILVKAEGRKNSAGEDYYYCYRPKVWYTYTGILFKEGVTIGFNQEEVYFKNIKIKTKRDNRNQLCLFACPFFNEGSKTILNIVPTVYGCSIATQKPLTLDSPYITSQTDLLSIYNETDPEIFEKTDYDYDNPNNFKSYYTTVKDNCSPQSMPVDTEIYVELSSDFCYEYDSQKIKMNGGESWIYETSSVAVPEDEKIPYISKFIIEKNSAMPTIISSGVYYKDCLRTHEKKSMLTFWDEYLNVKSKKLKIMGDVSNSLHGLNKITWQLYDKTLSGETDYTEHEAAKTNNGLIGSGNLSVSKEGAKSYLDYLLDLSDYILDNTEGIYCLNFKIYDNNGHDSEMKDYYFCYDDIAPAIPEDKIIVIDAGNKKHQTTSPNYSVDKKVYIQTDQTWSYDLQTNGIYMDNGKKNNLSTSSITPTSITFTWDGDLPYHDFPITVTDYSGNTGTVYKRIYFDE